MSIEIIAFSLVIIAILLFLVAFFGIRPTILTNENSTSTTGTLLGFCRRYFAGFWLGDMKNWAKDGAGRVPIFKIKIGDAYVALKSLAANKTLSKDDIGRELPVRFRNSKIRGLMLIQEDDRLLAKHNQIRQIFFWTVIGLAIALFISSIDIFMSVAVISLGN